MQIGLTGRRTKAARKAAAIRGYSFTVEESAKKEDSAEDHPLSSSSHDSQSKSTRIKRQDYSVAEPSNERRLHEDTHNYVEINEGKVDLWTPLNCLVEAANRTKSSKLNLQGPSLSKSEQPNAHDSEVYMPETKARAESPRAPDCKVLLHKSKRKEHGHNMKVHDETNGKKFLPGPLKHRRLRAAGRKSTAASGLLHSSAQAMLDVAGSKRNRRNSPVWFSLVASEDRKADVSLPQISACYLRIKDGKMPVSFIQKYLVKKLNLTSEAEVEIMCRGQPVIPSLQLHNVVDLWFQTASTSKKVAASVGSSGNDFVMALLSWHAAALFLLNTNRGCVGIKWAGFGGSQWLVVVALSVFLWWWKLERGTVAYGASRSLQFMGRTCRIASTWGLSWQNMTWVID
ncbi:hypothetical protein CIPAW_08G123000 [Carya illinoinensis]|uniref:E3 ubiquitin protein ligase DRIP2 n=1 Tax=Carya illinoinensis TaxID=32201 RepID=A0A8T1PYS9_CARIL|nr:hypothetical protein CIPAW_08G123000 [Carya illinoinensis]KAG6645441.1 hypothetical protein CIPAW_08G123000 [Carya illinoinensis]KAG6645442.1 hypothetical protein CIPAW_08G123000 [Carya illinoinensis]